MSDLTAAIEQFLALKRIAVVGVSRKGTEAANIVYKKLKSSGFEVFPVNPKAEAVEGDPCYPDIASIPGGVEGVFIATHPDVTSSIVEQCRQTGVGQVWIHRSFGQGSVSDEAVELCKKAGIAVIPGACPMMFCEPVDLGHKCMRWILRFTVGLPRPSVRE